MKAKYRPMFRSASLALMGCLCFTFSGHAASLTWDGNGDTVPNPNGGDGDWDSTSLNWWDGAANIAWPTTGSDNDAVFANTAGGATLLEAITANDLTFNTTNYYLAGTQTLTLNGATPTITTVSGVTAYIGDLVVIAGSAGLTKTGAGTLTLDGGVAHTFTGGVNLKAGTLALNFNNLSPATDLIPGGNTLTLGGSSLSLVAQADVASSQSFNGLMLNSGASTLSATDTGTGGMNVILGPITRNAGALVNFTLPVLGTITTSNPNAHGILGTWATTGATTLTKYVTLSGGSLAALTGTAAATGADLTDTTGEENYDLAAAAGAVPASMSAHTIRYTGAAATTAPGATLFSVNGLLNAGTGLWTIGTNALTIGADKDLLVNTANNSITISSVIQDNANGASSLTKAGANTLTLTGASTYSGKTTVVAGTLSINSLKNVGEGASALGAPTTIADGTIELLGNLTYTGAATTSDRVINLSGNSSLFSLSNNGALLTLTGGITGAGNLMIRGTKDTTASGLLEFTGNLTHTDAGTLTLSNASNSFADIQCAAGVVSADSIANAGVVSALGKGSTLTLGQTGSSTNGTLRFTGASGGSSNRAITVMSNGGTFGGIIESAVAGQTLTLSGNVTSGGAGATPALTLTGDGDGVLSGNITSTALGVTKAGAGTWTLSGTNSHAGTTTISAGTLIYGVADAIPTGPVTVSGGTLDLSTFSDSVGALTVSGGSIIGSGTLTATSHALTNAGTIGINLAGTGTLTKTGAGTATLIGTNSYTGANTLTAGTLSVSTAANLGDPAATVVFNGGNLQITGTTLSLLSGLGHTVTLTAAKLVGLDIADSLHTFTADMVLSQTTGGLTKLGAGKLVLNQANTYSGATTVSAGTLEITGAGTLGAGNYAGAISTAASATLLYNASATQTLTGQITVNGTLEIAAGQVDLAKATNNQFASSTGSILIRDTAILNASTAVAHTMYHNIVLQNGGVLSSAASSLADYGSYHYASNLSISGSGTGNLVSASSVGIASTKVLTLATPLAADRLTVSSPIGLGATGTAGALAKTGDGIVTLSGASTYTGGSTVNGGTLVISNPSGSATGTGTVNVNSGGTLAGTGSIGGLTSVNSGGTIAPGNSVGTLTTSSLTLGSGSNATFEFNSTPANDLIVVGTESGLTLNGGAISLVEEGTSTPATLANYTPYNLIQYSGSIAGSGVGALSVANPQPGKSYLFGTNGGFLTVSTVDRKAWDSEGGDDNLTTPANWVGDSAPVATDVLTFGTGARVNPVNDFSANTSFGGIIFEATNSAAFTLTGNAIDLIGAVSNDGGPNNAINLNLALLVGGGSFSTIDSNLTLGGIVSGSEGLTKNGNGTLILQAANTYTGGTAIAAGTLELSGTGQLGAGTYANTISNNGTLLINSTADQALNGVISGSGSLTKSSASTLTLGAANSYAGGTTISAGTVLLGTPTALGTAGLTLNGGTLDLNANSISLPSLSGTGGIISDSNATAGTSTLTVNQTGTTTFDGVIQSGATRPLALTKSGAGSLTLTAANTYTGATTLSGGTLALSGGDNRLPSTTTLGFTAASTLNLGATSQSISNLTLARINGAYSITGSGAALNLTPMPTDLVISGDSGETTTLNVSGTAVDLTAASRIVYIGLSSNSSAAGAHGTLNLTSATLEASTLYMAYVNYTGGGYAPSSTGTLTLNDSTCKAPTMTLGRSNKSNAYATIVVNINSGSNLYAQSIARGTTYGTATFNWNDGSIGNYDASTNLSIGTGIVIKLAATGTHDFDISSGRQATIGSALSNATSGGTLVKNGAGTLILSAANTYNGSTTINTGTLNLTGSLTGGTAITVNNAAVLTQGAASVISGAASITHASSATSTLAGANTYSGGTTVTGGTLLATNASALGTNSGLTLNGGVLLYRPTVAGALDLGTGAVNLADGSRIGTALGGTALSESAITSTGVAVTTGTVTVDIWGILGVSPTPGSNNLITAASGLDTANYTLGNVHNATNFTVSGLSKSPTAVSITVAEATPLTDAYWLGNYSGGAGIWSLTSATPAATTSNWASDAIGTLTPLIPSSSTTVHFSATGAINKETMTLGFPMNVAGIAIDDSAAVTLNADGNTLTLGTAGVTVNSGAGAVTLGSAIALGGIQTWTHSGSNALTVSGVLSGAGDLTKTGAGTLILSAANTHTGVTTVSGGTLALAHVNALATSTLDTGLADTQQVTFTVEGSNTYNLGNLQGADDLAIAANTLSVGAKNAAATFSGAITGSDGNLTKGGTGLLTLEGTTANTYTGMTTVTGPGGLKLNKAADVTAVAGDLTFVGSGNPYTMLYTTANNQLSPTSVVNFTGVSYGIWELLGTTQTVAGINSGTGSGIIENHQFYPTSNSGTGTLVLAGAGTYSFAATLRNQTGVIALSKTGIGTQTLSGASIIYTGATTVSDGVLKLATTTAWNSNITNNATVEFSAPGDWTIGAAETFSGSGTYIKTGSGILNLGNHIITATGKFLIQEGTFRNNSNSCNWTTCSADMDISAGATLDLWADDIYVDALTGAGTVNNGYNQAQKLTVGVADGNGSFTGILKNTSNVMSLVKAGGGTQALTGDNTYTGSTTVNGGTLAINNTTGSGTGSGTVTVQTTGTLAGNGSISGATTIKTTGVLAPGNNDVATLNFGGNVTLDVGSNYAVEVTSASASDKINLGVNTLAANGTISITAVGHTFAAGDSYDVADATTITGSPTISPATPGTNLAWDTTDFASQGVIKVISTGIADPYGDWAGTSGYNLTGPDAAKDADPDGDGVNNLLEFATAGDPTSATSGPRCYPLIHTLGAENALTYTVAVRKDATAGFVADGSKQSATKDLVVYTVEGTDDLATWNLVPVTEVTGADATAVQTALGDQLTTPALDSVNYEWHTFRTNGGTAADPSDFIRLKVSEAP